MNSEVRYYLSIFLKRLPIVIVLTAIAAAASAYYALSLPSRYSAQALLLIEQPQIPNQLAASTVQNNAPEQMEIIEQRLLTRANVIDIANKFDIYPPEMVPDDVVDAMRASARFRLNSGRDRATTVTVSFTDDRPEITFRVVNEFVTRILESNVQLRTGIASETLDFFEQEVEQLDRDLAAQAARILAFKNENLDALPESMNYRMNRQSQLMERRAQIQRDLSGLTEERARLVEVFESTGRVDAGGNLTPQQRQLQQLQNELDAALAVYSPQNPRIKVLQARIAQLEEVIAGDLEGSDQPTGQSLLDLQLAQIDSRASFLEEQLRLIDGELGELQASIARTPANTITLEALERDYENIQSRFNAASSRLATAATGERIELTAKGQRITVLRQATTPREPSSPNRPAIIMLGTAVGVAAAFGLIVLLELLNTKVRRPADITKGLGIMPLATVPYIATGGEVARRRGIATAVVAVLVLGIPAALYYVHVSYLPLDLIADRAISRLGL